MTVWVLLTQCPYQANVLPAQSVEISVEMVAPPSPGTFQGNWKLMQPGR